MRHDRHAIISGANLISVMEAACARGPGPRHEPARSRAPAKFQQLGRRLACRRLAALRSHGRMVRPEYGRRPIQKARGRFPGAGSNYFAMMGICR
jgi:hypothetical protein